MGGRGLQVAVLASVAITMRPAAAHNGPMAALGLIRSPGAESCITPHDLAVRVETRLGRAAFASAAAAALFVDVRIAANGQGWQATVTASRATGEQMGTRELATIGGDCHGLDDDLVLVIALAIDPLATEQPVAPPPRDLVYVPVPVPVAVPPPPWSFVGRATSAFLVSRLPTLAPALDVSVAATPPLAWPIELGVLATTSASATTDDHGADLRLVLGTIAVCPELAARGRYTASACGGAALGALLIRARGLDPTDTGNAFAADLLARMRGAVRITSRLDALVEAGAMVPLTRRSLYYTALDPMTLEVSRHEVYAVPVVAFSVAVGLGVHFP